jgi:hypothetical protein
MTAKRSKATFNEAMKEGEASKPKTNGIPVIVSWRRINSEDPVWFVTIEGGSGLEMMITDVRDITDYRRFANQCVRQLSMFFMPVKQSTWAEALIDARHLMSEEQADEDTTLRGQFAELLQTYLTNRQCGQKKEDLLSGRPWEDEDERRHYFELSRLIKFLDREGMRNQTPQACAAWIDELGGGVKQTTIKGKSIRLRWVPSGAFQETPEVSPPELPPAVI